MPGDRIRIGTVIKPHGIKGGLRVRASSDALLGLERVFVADREHKVARASRAGADVLLELEGLGDRDAAAALRGAPLFADRAALPALGESELYVADLVGCQVFNASGARLGEVSATFHSGAHEVLVVRGAGGELMLPFVESIITGVDLADRRIDCDPPPGLIDLDPKET